jgi:hypothetical protein
MRSGVLFATMLTAASAAEQPPSNSSPALLNRCAATMSHCGGVRRADWARRARDAGVPAPSAGRASRSARCRFYFSRSKNPSSRPPCIIDPCQPHRQISTSHSTRPVWFICTTTLVVGVDHGVQFLRPPFADAAAVRSACLSGENESSRPAMSRGKARSDK